MPITVAVPRETRPGERRVALDPPTAGRLIKQFGVKVLVERGAGEQAFFPDAAYEAQGCGLTDEAAAALGADVVLKVAPPSVAEVEALREGATLLSVIQPHLHQEQAGVLRQRNITAFAMELVPRITRAQSMDVLSSQAAVAGYKVALIAADLASGFFPMLTTAAGTIRPARVVVIGAGVAGLQAIATCRRLGALVEAYDIRPAAREEVASLGAKMIDTGVDASAAGGYARELTDEEKQRQADVLAKHIAAARVVITTAAVPGRPAPKIVSAAMVEGMQPGAVVVDMAAEGGGNCELTRAGENVAHGGVTVAGPVNIASSLAMPASEMFARNLFNFLTPMLKEGELALDWEDEVIAGTALTHGGEIKHGPTRELLGD